MLRMYPTCHLTDSSSGPHLRHQEPCFFLGEGAVLVLYCSGSGEEKLGVGKHLPHERMLGEKEHWTACSETPVVAFITTKLHETPALHCLLSLSHYLTPFLHTCTCVIRSCALLDKLLDYGHRSITRNKQPGSLKRFRCFYFTAFHFGVRPYVS